MTVRARSVSGVELCRQVDELQAENARLRRLVVSHPAVEALRFVAPLVRAAIHAGMWEPGAGTDSVEREIASTLGWLDRLEGAA